VHLHPVLSCSIGRAIVHSLLPLVYRLVPLQLLVVLLSGRLARILVRDLRARLGLDKLPAEPQSIPILIDCLLRQISLRCHVVLLDVILIEIDIVSCAGPLVVIDSRAIELRVDLCAVHVLHLCGARGTY
jgi:hypothetical protein